MRLIPALILTIAVLPMVADSTGRLSGKITSMDGKPVPKAKVTLKRVDINWVKELAVSEKGTFMQVGLNPKEFDFEVSAEGFTTHLERIKIPLGDTLSKEVILLTTAEARKAAVATGKAVLVEDPGANLDSAGSEAFNQAAELFNDKKYAEALPLVELSYLSLKESSEKMKDENAKADVAKKLTTVERIYAVTLFEVGSASESKADLLVKAKPILEKCLAANSKDTRSIDALQKIAKAQKDKEGEKKYQGMLDAILGPRPEIAFNEGVAAFNANNMKEAKEHLLRSIEIKPDYADSYYLLGMVEFSHNNLKGTKTNLLKYLELAPTGKDAATAREMLKDPSLRNVK